MGVAAQFLQRLLPQDLVNTVKPTGVPLAGANRDLRGGVIGVYVGVTSRGGH